MSDVEWQYYVVENAFVVRADLKQARAERLMRNGSWVDYPDVADVSYNGRYLDGEAKALATARKLFELYPELP
jgi:hypothetical protein